MYIYIYIYLTIYHIQTHKPIHYSYRRAPRRPAGGRCEEAHGNWSRGREGAVDRDSLFPRIARRVYP